MDEYMAKCSSTLWDICPCCGPTMEASFPPTSFLLSYHQTQGTFRSCAEELQMPRVNENAFPV